ncbi:MAG: hypothetical protein HFG67_02045, partial [Firmicutes bacterium]|nr:hypothetical protein [Bacillota bacterium]
MKKFKLKLVAVLIAVLACLGIAACTDSKEIMNDYIDIISQEAETDQALKEILAEAEDYMASNMSKLEKEDADYMVYLYMDKAQLVIGEDTEKFESLVNDYGVYLSDTMNDVLAIELNELRQPLPDFANNEQGDNEAFWREAMERALAVEETVNNHKETLTSAEYEYIKTEIVWRYKYYINYMLIGSPDRLLFDSETHMFDDDAMNVYSELAQANPDTVSAYAVNEFFNYLASIRYELDLRDSDSG